MLRPKLIPLFLLLLAGSLLGQTQPEAVHFHTLALRVSVDELYYDLGPRRIPLKASPTSLSAPYLRPKSGVVDIYRLAPATAPGAEPVRVPVARATLGNEGPFILLFSKDNNDTLHTRVIENSWSVHPQRASRVFNASGRRAAVLVGSDMVEIAPGQHHVFPPASRPGAFEFKVATQDPDGWNVRVLSPQIAIPRTRNIFVLLDQIPTPQNPAPEALDVFTIVDATQPPAPEKSRGDVAMSFAPRP